MQIHLSYTPDAPERKKTAKRRGNGFRYSIPDAVRLPLGEGSSLPTVPPLILLNKDRIAQISIDTENLNDSPLTVQASVDGVLHGSETLRMMELGDEIETIRMRTNGPADSVQSGLSEGKLTLSSDRPGIRSYPLKFLAVDGDTPICTAVHETVGVATGQPQIITMSAGPASPSSTPSKSCVAQ